MKQTLLVATLASSFVWATGCWRPSADPGNVTPAGVISCALTRETPAGSQTLFCVETLGLTVNQAQADQSPCEAEATEAGDARWTFAYQACSHTGALGGCRLTTDVTQEIMVTQWYYAGGNYVLSDSEAGADASAPMCPSNYTFIAP